MKLLKKWGIGDLVKNQTSFPIDGTTQYEHIEALDGSDIDNHISIRRSVRNIMENEENIEEYFNAVLSQIATGDNDRTVLVNSFSDFQQSFKVDANDIIYFDDIDTSRKAYLRVNPGIGILNFSPVIVKPQIFAAERELEKIFSLDTWHPQAESATILHDFDAMKYHLQIEKKDGSGNIVTYQFANGGVYGDLGSTQASATVTSISASGASFTVSAVNKAAYDGIDGNGVEVQFLNSGITGLEVAFLDGAKRINVNLGDSNATAAEIVDAINALRDFEATVDTAGDFTTADDASLSATLSGGAEPVGYNNSIEMFVDLADHTTLGPIFTSRITSYASLALEQLIDLSISATVDVHVGFDIDGNLITTNDPEVPYMQLWRIQVDTLAETAPTLTDERLGYSLTEYNYDWNSSATYSVNDIVFENGQIWTAIQTSTNVRPSEDENREYWLEAGGGAGTSIVEYEPYDPAYVEGDFVVGMPGALREGKVVPASKSGDEKIVGLFVEDRSGTLLFQKISLIEDVDQSIINTDPYSARATLTADSTASFEIVADEDGGYTGVSGNGITVEFEDTGVNQASVTITSNTSSSPGTFTASATAGGAFDGFAGNDINVAFIDSGSGGLDVSFDGANILVDFGDSATVTSTDIVSGINLLTDFEATDDTTGDFALADDNGRLEGLSGGTDGLQLSFNGTAVTIDFGGLATLEVTNIVSEINSLTDFRATSISAGDFTAADDIALSATLSGGYDTGFFEVDEPVFVGDNGNLIQNTDNINKEEYRIFIGYASASTSIDIQLNEPMLVTDNPQYWDSVPLGGLIFNSSTTIRDGYLQANGQELSRTNYSQLNDIYAADGYPHGDGDGSTTFNIPAYEDPSVIIKVRNVSVLTQEETVSVDNRLTTLETESNNLGTAAFTDTNDFVSMQRTAINRTVGPEGQHATINEAIEYLSSRETEYKAAGIPVTITLLDGFVMQEQVLVNDKDLGWITILSQIGGAPVSIDSITQGTQITGYEQPEISQVSINDYEDVSSSIIQDASELNGSYFSLQLANGDEHYFWYNTNAFARANFSSVYVRYDTAGSGGNGYNIVVDNDTAADRALSASLSSTTITVELAVSGGELDDSANTANLVAAEINAISGFSATSTNSLEITGSYDVSFSGGGNAADPSLTGQTGNEIAYLTGDTPTEVATKTATVVDGVTGLGATSTNEVVTITNDNVGTVEDISGVGYISVTTTQQGRDVSYHIQVNATSHGFSGGDNILIREHRSVIEEYNYDGSYEVRTDNLTADSFELVFDDTENTIYEETRSGIDGEGEVVIPEPVPVSRQNMTQMWEFFYYPAFGVARGTLPTIGCIFEMDSSTNSIAGYESYIDGFCATDRGHINFLPGGNAGFRNADGSGIYATRSSVINANDAIADSSGRHGFWAYSNSIINARGGSANDCGWRAPDSPGYSSGAIFDGLGRPIGNAVFATRGSLINADGISALNSHGDAIIATYGATINVGEHGSGGPTYSASSIYGDETKTIGGFITGIGADANVIKTNEMEINNGISSENDLTEFKSNIILNKGLYTLAAAKLTWNSTTDTYSNHFVDTSRIHERMRRCVITRSGDIRYYLDANDSTLKEDGTAATLDGSHGSVMVEIPKFYVKFSATGISEDREYTWEISDYPAIGYSVHPAFIRNGIEVNYRYISAYDACIWDDSAGAFVSGLNYDNNTANIDTAVDYAASVSGVYPMVGTTRNESRILTANFGTGFSLQDFYLSSAIQLLILLEFGTFNSQSAIGQGNTQKSGWPVSSGVQSDNQSNIAGLSNSFGNNTANVSTSGGSTNDFMSYRGIENFFGNVWNWIDGFNINDRQAYVSNVVADFADDTSTNYTTLGSVMPSSSNYVRDIQNLSFSFLPSSVSGASDSTYLTDYYYQSTGWRVARLGGNAFVGLRAGAWAWSVANVAADASRSLGFRSSV